MKGLLQASIFNIKQMSVYVYIKFNFLQITKLKYAWITSIVASYFHFIKVFHPEVL
jgi:hypothetical protein